MTFPLSTGHRDESFVPAVAESSLLIAFVLDQSGSMKAVAQATRSAFNEFIEEQKEQPGPTWMSLTLFNTRFEERYVGADIRKIPKLTRSNYRPGGMTALDDAVGSTIDSLQEGLEALSPSERPDKILVVIQTDGHENSSQEYTREQVNELREAREKDGWAFLFLGADQDAWDNPYGIARANTMSYDSADIGHTVAFASTATTDFRSGKRSATNLTGNPEGVDTRKKK